MIKVALDLESSLLLESHSPRLPEGLKTGMVGSGVGGTAGDPATTWDQLDSGVATVMSVVAGGRCVVGGTTVTTGGMAGLV